MTLVGSPERAGQRVGMRVLQVLGALVLALACLPTFTPPGLDLMDGSWVLANSWAHELGLRWGSDLAYTYGPLGFLKNPVPFTPALVAAGLVFWVSTCLAIVTGVLALVGTRLLGWVLAFVSTSMATCTTEVAAPLVGISLIALAVRLRSPEASGWPFVALGAASALLLLTKFNSGVTAFAVVATLALFGPGRWRAAAGTAAGFLGGLVVLWLTSGGDVPGLVQFSRDSVSLAAGYGHALSNGSRTSGAIAIYLAGGLLFGVLVGSSWWAAREADRRVRIGVVLATVLFGVSAWLQGFSRFDPGHLAIYFSMVGAICLPLVARALAAWGSGVRIAGLLACYALAAGPLLVALGSPGGGGPIRMASPTALAHPRTSFSSLTGSLDLISSQEARNARLDSLQAQFLSEGAVSEPIAAAVAGRAVHAEPQAAGLVWALDGSWAPVPVFQTHMAYTRHLDSRNADYIRDSDFTQVVVREDFGLDGTNPLWQSPQLQVEYVCRFRVTAADSRWTALERSADRCGQEQPLQEQQVGAAVSVPVPASDAMVVANLEPVGRINGRLEVSCDGRTYPLMQELPSGPLIMRLPESAGWVQQSSPLACSSVSFSAPVKITWSEIPLNGA